MTYQANVEIARMGNTCWLSTIEKIAHLSNFHSNLDNEKNATRKVAIFLEDNSTKQIENNIFNDERSTDSYNKLRTFRKFKTNVKKNDT